jgi:transcription factor C subunit 7
LTILTRLSCLGIGEWYSPVKPGTGLHPRPYSAKALKAHVTLIDDSWTSIWYPPRKGEGVQEVHDRVAGFLEVFFPELERRQLQRHSHILFVTHAATAIVLVRELLGNRSLPLRVGCCSLTVMTRKKDTSNVVGSWNALTVSDGTHLRNGTSREWGFDDIEIDNGQVCQNKVFGDSLC